MGAMMILLHALYNEGGRRSLLPLGDGGGMAGM